MKRKLFKIITAGLLSVALIGCSPAPTNNLDKYQKIARELDPIQVIDTSELTLDVLENRNGNLVIEKCIGKVTNAEKDGEILNYRDKEYSYISYKSVREAKAGNVILTYFIYNPDSNVHDDILYRFDYVIDNTTQM